MNINTAKIYYQIGNLFYAIAIELSGKSFNLLQVKELIGKHWLPEGDNLKARILHDAVEDIFTAMDNLHAERVCSNEAYNIFARFYALYTDCFSDELKWRISDTATAIAHLFHANSSSESSHLYELKTLLWPRPAYATKHTVQIRQNRGAKKISSKGIGIFPLWLGER